MKDFQHIPEVRDMLAKAQKILGYNILDVMLNGPEDKLLQTRHCQPAMYIAGLAAVEKLRLDEPEKVERCQAVAGLSLGEYTALTVAGVFDFETGLRIVKLRAEVMQAAADESDQAMLSVAGLERDTLDRLCAESSSAPGEVCAVANDL